MLAVLDDRQPLESLVSLSAYVHEAGQIRVELETVIKLIFMGFHLKYISLQNLPCSRCQMSASKQSGVTWEQRKKKGSKESDHG